MEEIPVLRDLVVLVAIAIPAVLLTRRLTISRNNGIVAECGRGFSIVLVLFITGFRFQSGGASRLPPPVASLSEEFSDISSIREVHDSLLLITDRKENRLVVANFRARTVTPISRPGDGPGEYRGVGWLYGIGQDSTLLSDWQTRRWFVLRGTRIVATLQPDHVLSRMFGAILSGADSAGHVLGVRGIAFSSLSRMAEFADSLALLRVNRASGSIDTVVRLRGRGPAVMTRRASSLGTRGIVSALPLSTEEQGLMFPDGWVAIAHMDPYHVVWRSPDGRSIVGAPLPFEPVSLDDLEKCAVIAREQSVAVQGMCDPTVVKQWPKFLPPFLPIALLASPTGQLVIRRTPNARSRFNRYDVVSRSGSLSRSVDLPLNEKIVGFGASSVYTVTTSDVGIQRVRRHAWP